MSCSQTLKGIARDCSASMGGIVRVLLANHADVTALTIADGVITAITMATGKTFYEYALRLGTSNLTHSRQINAENGVNYVQSSLQMVFNRMETAKRLEITAIAQADLAAIVEDANGVFWFLGKDHPVTISAEEDGTGTARSDRNGYSVTLQDNSLQLPLEVSSSIIAGLLPTPA